jgi:hypothetical protein
VRDMIALERRSSELFGERHIISVAVAERDFDLVKTELEHLIRDLDEFQSNLPETVEK